MSRPLLACAASGCAAALVAAVANRRAVRALPNHAAQLAGRIESGKARVGDKVVFLPSNKSTAIKSIEKGIPMSGKSTNMRTFGPGFMLRTAPSIIMTSCPSKSSATTASRA